MTKWVEKENRVQDKQSTSVMYITNNISLEWLTHRVFVLLVLCLNKSQTKQTVLQWHLIALTKCQKGKINKFNFQRPD